MVVPFFLNNFMIIFVVHLDRFVGCVQAFGRGALLGCGIFFFPRIFWGQEERQTECMCRVPSGVSSCTCVIVCCVCECPSDWLSVTPEKKNRIFPLHRTFFFDIFFFNSPLISRVRFWNKKRTEYFETWKTRSRLCGAVWNLGNKWLKTSPISSFWIISRRLTSWC